MIANQLPRSLADNPRLDAWIGFETPGRVRISTGKVELGQGVLTALVQIAAEELDVEPTRLRLVSGEAGEGPNEGYTAGSYSVENSGGAIRIVCAEVRALFLDRTASLLACGTEELSIEDGAFRRSGKGTGFDYWRLAGDIDLSCASTGGASAKPATACRLVGTSLPRTDLPEKIGGGAFIHDMVMPGMLHARVLRQPWRGAILGELDERALHRAARRPIEVLREGSLVALLGEDEASVEAAAVLAREKARWTGGEIPPDAVVQPDWLTTQPAVDRVIANGKPAAGERVEATYSRGFIAHGSIGPSCALARWDGAALEVWTHSQGVYPLRQSLAAALGLDLASVSVRHRQAAGCYGHNGADDAAFDAAFLALKRPGHTVRAQWTRADELTASPFGAPMTVKLDAVLDPEGRPADWGIEIWSAPHGQRPGMHRAINLIGAEALPGAPPRVPPGDVPDANGFGAARNAIAFYDLPAQRIVTHFVAGHPVRTSSLRGLGAFANVFAIESFIDELAEATGQDPVAYRLSLSSDPRARGVIEAAAAMAGWSPDAAIGEGTAKGFGFSRYKNKAAYMAAVAEVALDEEVRVTRVWCAVDAGLVINPDGAANQVEGGVIQAASWTLKEAVRFENGRATCSQWDDYPILRFSEVPEVEVRFIDMASEPALGLGEVAQGPTAAAIGNAVARALGARIRDLPLSRARIMEALL
ncbi:xanthine dehydrogenase family protein molybdopterin-binding subunit [Ancylobacter defluvii]|uniref:Oxidoreductase n=1 Tax=Ancylobacter defluvii TaxID=1282440 RepID=A0A9W6NCZ1_9HYPH|nr:molybdopterin cofactor-binding domain-containing protein [Ancylobacter defluvii]MBS7586864.1 xanthine dehydrogenase family protein molybdopterin-binding subunit [Ancylobacter defluvii]GLK86170.1 oxidoreductase [Ancylobacter defluvii]